MVKEVKTGGEQLTKLLNNYSAKLDDECLNRCLRAATRNDNHLNISKLVVKGANDFDTCLELARKENKPHARGMLLLIKAAYSDDKAIVQKLFGEVLDKTGYVKDELLDTGFPDVQKVVLSGKVSTVLPIEIARKYGNLQVREELLLKTDVNLDEGYVHWNGLHLVQLELSWLRKISWVRKLLLSRNSFKTLPDNMDHYLKQVGN